eukprot:364629-Chlamydomonas_euryale.AAC.5
MTGLHTLYPYPISLNHTPSIHTPYLYTTHPAPAPYTVTRCVRAHPSRSPVSTHPFHTPNPTPAARTAALPRSHAPFPHPKPHTCGTNSSEVCASASLARPSLSAIRASISRARWYRQPPAAAANVSHAHRSAAAASSESRRHSSCGGGTGSGAGGGGPALGTPGRGSSAGPCRRSAVPGRKQCSESTANATRTSRALRWRTLPAASPPPPLLLPPCPSPGLLPLSPAGPPPLSPQNTSSRRAISHSARCE